MLLYYVAVATHIFVRGDPEVHAWSDVLPGDMVVSPGSSAWSKKALSEGDSRSLRLGRGILLVIARNVGFPLDDTEDEFDRALTTFTVVSRHGILVLMQRPRNVQRR